MTCLRAECNTPARTVNRIEGLSHVLRRNLASGSINLEGYQSFVFISTFHPGRSNHIRSSGSAKRNRQSLSHSLYRWKYPLSRPHTQRNEPPLLERAIAAEGNESPDQTENKASEPLVCVARNGFPCGEAWHFRRRRGLSPRRI